MLTCSILRDRLHYYTCFTYKETKQVRRAQKICQGQAASNCQKKKLRNNTIHPTTSKLPLTTDKHSIKRATVDPNLQKCNSNKKSLKGHCTMGQYFSLQVLRWHSIAPGFHTCRDTSQRRPRGCKGRFCELQAPFSTKASSIYFYFMNWRFPHMI